ncbi:hypothetical protein D3C77_420490 [compost metagenome]
MQNAEALPSPFSADSYECRCGAAPPTASYRKLCQKHRQTNDDQANYKEQEESGPSVFTGNIGEFPHVPQADGTADRSQYKSSRREAILLPFTITYTIIPLRTHYIDSIYLNFSNHYISL